MTRETLRARPAAATPGPWHAGGDGAVCSDHVEGSTCWPVASTSNRGDARAIESLSVHAPALLALADAVAAMFDTRYTTWSGNGDEPPADAQWLHDPTEVRKALAALEALP